MVGAGDVSGCLTVVISSMSSKSGRGVVTRNFGDICNEMDHYNHVNETLQICHHYL